MYTPFDVWLAFGCGAVLAAVVTILVVAIGPEIVDAADAWLTRRRIRRAAKAGVVDLATARLQRNLREDLRARRGGR